MAEEWEILNDELEMWDLVEPGMSPSQSPNSIALWETVDIEVKLSETLDTGTKAIDNESEIPNIIGYVQMKQSNKSADAVKPLDVTLDVKAKKVSDTLDVGMKLLDKRDLKMPQNTINNAKEKQSKESVDIAKPLEKEQQSVVIKPPKTVDNELAALLTKWDLDDAAKALAKHGWTTVSLLKQFNPDKHMDELDLSSGQACGLVALLQSIQEVPITVRVFYEGFRYEFEVLPSDSVGALKAKLTNNYHFYNLFLRYEKLMDDRSLSSYKIQLNTTLILKQNSFS
jgi:hypothetical protein